MRTITVPLIFSVPDESALLGALAHSELFDDQVLATPAAGVHALTDAMLDYVASCEPFKEVLETCSLEVGKPARVRVQLVVDEQVVASASADDVDPTKSDDLAPLELWLSEALMEHASTSDTNESEGDE